MPMMENCTEEEKKKALEMDLILIAVFDFVRIKRGRPDFSFRILKSKIHRLIAAQQKKYDVLKCFIFEHENLGYFSKELDECLKRMECKGILEQPQDKKWVIIRTSPITEVYTDSFIKSDAPGFKRVEQIKKIAAYVSNNLRDVGLHNRT